MLGLCIASGTFATCQSSHARQGNRINEKWETTNNTFKVQITAYAEENRGFVGGAYYLFRSAEDNSESWNDIMTFRHDDPVPIPREQVRFVNDRIGYVFMGWMYAATTDGGRSWSVWDARKDLPDWSCCNYRLIQDVRMQLDGVGRMTLNPIPGRPAEASELETQDYGQSWRRQ